jgi:hypothetical protein
MSEQQDCGCDETNESGSAKQNIRCYTEDSLRAALELIKSGSLTISAASKIYLIPWSTLKNRMSNPIPQQVGGIPLLSAEKENLLADWLIKCAELGDPRTRDELLSAAGEFVDENNQKIFKNGTPTSSWLQGFMKRNPTVSFRTHSNLSRASANVSAAEIVGFIDGMKKSFGRSEGKKVSRCAVNLLPYKIVPFTEAEADSEIIGSPHQRSQLELALESSKKSFDKLGELLGASELSPIVSGIKQNLLFIERSISTPPNLPPNLSTFQLTASPAPSKSSPNTPALHSSSPVLKLPEAFSRSKFTKTLKKMKREDENPKRKIKRSKQN